MTDNSDIGVIGVITAAAGRIMGDVGRWGNYAVAVIFFGVGLYLLDVIRITPQNDNHVPRYSVLLSDALRPVPS